MGGAADIINRGGAVKEESVINQYLHISQYLCPIDLPKVHCFDTTERGASKCLLKALTLGQLHLFAFVKHQVCV